MGGASYPHLLPGKPVFTDSMEEKKQIIKVDLKPKKSAFTDKDWWKSDG